jgi:hypothetical protein
MRQHLRLIPFIGFLLILPALPATPDGPSSVRPVLLASGGATISVREALDITDRYTADKKLDLSGQYIVSVSLQVESRNGRYWFVQWSVKNGRPKGTQYNLKIFMDGTVAPAPADK